MKDISFTFLVTTLNRPYLLERCLESLIKQTYRNFEIVVVDQSDSNETSIIVNKLKNSYPGLVIIYIHSKVKKLSNARNIGIKSASGDFFCIVDDDAEYDKNYLSTAKDILDKYNPSIISGVIYDSEKEKFFVEQMKFKEDSFLNINEIFSICLSAGLVISRNIFNEIGGFDEKFGIGAIYGSSEESDLLVRAINKGEKIYFTKKLILFHRLPEEQINDTSILKSYNYAKGGGALVRKHWASNKMFFTKRAIKLIFGPFFRMIGSRSDWKKIRMQYARLKGHLYGIIKYEIDQ